MTNPGKKGRRSSRGHRGPTYYNGKTWYCIDRGNTKGCGRSTIHSGTCAFCGNQVSE